MGLFAWDRYVIPQALIVRPAARPSSFGTGQHRPCPNLYSTAETLYVWNLFIRSLTLASCTFCCAISGLADWCQDQDQDWKPHRA